MRSTRTRVAAVFASLLVAPFLWWAPAEAATPTLSVDDVEWFEESPLGPFFHILVRLSAPTDHAVSVSYHTADGTAQGGWQGDPESDYARTGGDVTIPAGETAASSTRELWINDDDRVEGDEHFFVRLYDPVGGTIADGTATILINNASSDRDPPPAFVQPNGVLEADTDTTVSVLLKLGARSATEQTVTVRTAVPPERAATPGEDYEAIVAVLRFPAGTLGRRFDIPILGDQLDEADENINVEVVDGFSTTSPDESMAQVQIVDDDSPSSK
jgi:hypothetical protein